jgi:threonine/homoserine/homoserine lactone efflux protein
VLLFFVIGVAAGALTGVPIGPVNVAVIDAAYRHTFVRAIGVGIGGACGDGLWSGLGVLGVTPIVRQAPSVPPLLYAVSGVVLLVYGFMTARRGAVPPPAPAPAPGGDDPPPSDSVVTRLARRQLWSGFHVGLALVVLNPAAIVTWVVILSNQIPSASTTEGIAFTVGVMLGSVGWFALVAFLTHRGKNVLGDKAAWIPRIVGIGLILYASYLLARAVKYVAGA